MQKKKVTAGNSFTTRYLKGCRQFVVARRFEELVAGVEEAVRRRPDPRERVHGDPVLVPQRRLSHGLPHAADGGDAEEGRGRQVGEDAAEELILREDALLEGHGDGAADLGRVATFFHYFSL